MPKLTPPNDPPPVRLGTLVETDEDIRQAELANKAAIPLATPIAKKAYALLAVASPFRPTVRPPICVLTVFDDGKSEGEVIRIGCNHSPPEKIRDNRGKLGRKGT